MSKLIVNPSACLVGAGCGWASLMGRANSEVMRAVCFDQLVEAMPGRLRHASAAVASKRLDTANFTSNAYIVVGYSQRFARVAGYLFDAEAFFTPRQVSTFSTPYCADLIAMGAFDVEHITGCVQEQLTVMSRDVGGVVDETVIAAVLTPGMVSTQALSWKAQHG